MNKDLAILFLDNLTAISLKLKQDIDKKIDVIEKLSGLILTNFIINVPDIYLPNENIFREFEEEQNDE